MVAQKHTKSRPPKKIRIALNAAQDKALQDKLFEVNDRVLQNITSEVRHGLESLETEGQAAHGALAAGELPVISTQDFIAFTSSVKLWAREIFHMADTLEKSGVEELNRFMEKQALEKSKERFGVKQ